MADDAKISTAGSVKDWVEAYYGDDAFDISKAKKIGHIYHTAQFSACCYVISKASKKAHADLFDSNYAAVDTTYARIAEMCIKLLEIKFREDRPLTKADFLKCGWKNIFDEKKLDEYFEDYVGPAGILDRCQSCFPIIKDKDNDTDYERTADGFKAVKDDFEDVRKDHTYLLTLTGAKDSGILSRENVFKLFDSTTDAASKTWKEKKSEKSAGEKGLLKLNEEMFHSRYELVKSTTKNAVVAGAAVMSLGAVISGVFWPAILLIPEYSLLKKNMPDMFKSLGKYWGQIEKKFKTKRDIKRADAAQKYIVSFAETNGKPKLPFKVRRYLRKSDITILKKQAKVVRAGLSLEWSDEKKHDSELEIAKKALFNSRFYSQSNSDIMKKDELAPVDLQSVLENEIKAINPNEVGFGQMISVAGDIKEFASKLPSDAQESVQNQYAEKLMASAKHLIFETPLETLTDYQDKTAKFITDNSVLFEPIKDIRPDIVETIKRYSTMAGKEIKGLKEKDLGKSLEDYIMRTPEPNNTSFKINWEASKTEFKDPTNESLKKVIDAISDLHISDKDEKAFVGNGYDITKLNQEIANIADDKDRDLCDQLLKDQMRRVSYEKTRADSRATFEALTKKNSNLGGKLNFNEAFKKISEVTYDNIGNYVRFYEDTSTMDPPQAGAYLRAKFRSAVHDKMFDYANEHNTELKTDLQKIAIYLKNVNASQYLDEQQKQKLSEKVKPFIEEALETTCLSVASNFGAFKADVWTGYIDKPYESDGFKTLFKSNSSSEIQGIKEKMEFMSSLKDVQDSLKFGKYGMDTGDRDIISAILLRNNGGNFDKTITRENDDVLLNFLKSGIRPTGTNKLIEPKDMNNIKVKSDSCYGEIEEKLGWIVGGTNVQNHIFANVDDNDKYAALIALKTEFCREFEEFFTANILKQSEGKSVSNWLSTVPGASDYWRNIVAAWRPLANEIDSKITNLSQKVKLMTKSTNSLAEFLKIYDVIDSSKVKVTTRERSME